MKGTLYLILCGMFLGTIGIFVKLAGADASPILLTVFRVMLSALMILALIILTRDMKTFETLGIKRKHLLPFLIAGFFGVTIGFGFFVKSFYYIPVSNAVILVYVYPLVTALLSWLFLGEKMTKWEIVAIALVLAGVWAIYGSELNLQTSAFGNMLALAAGCGYSVFFVFMRHFEKKGMPYWKVTFWPLVIGGLILILLIPSESLVFRPSGMVPVWIFGLAFFSFLGYIFYAKGLKTIRAHNAVITVSLTEPLTAMILALVVLSEPLPPYILVGGALIIFANILVGKEHKKKRMRAAGKPGAGFGWVW